MAMSSDYELCIQLCTKCGITPPNEILEAMRLGSSVGELRLSSLSIVVPVCEVIGRVLASSSTIKLVDLSDCMLISRGLSKILEALYDGSNVISLNLKGNNISGSIVSQLGDIFHNNNTLKKLYIEWNALGSDVESFEKFCKGLYFNHNIEELDLRYNQINFHCAKYLSNVLMKNKSLKIINLAWNALGGQGGQLILNGMKENNNIIQLDLRGNRIPTEIIEAIDNLTYNNQSKKIISQSNISKTVDAVKTMVSHGNYYDLPLTNSDRVIEDEQRVVEKWPKKNSCVSEHKRDLIITEEHKDADKNSDGHLKNSSILHEVTCDNLNKNEKTESKNITASSLNFLPEKIYSNETELNKKISEVNQILQDRTVAINVLKNEVSIKDSEIEATKLLCDQLRIKINELEDEHKKFIEEHVKEIADIKLSHKSSDENWNKIYKELETLYNTEIEKNKEWEEKSRRYERNIRKNSLEIISLREKWMNKSQSYENLVEKSKTQLHRGKIELQEKENRHKIEINILKNTLKETTQALEECQTELKKSRIELRDTSIQLSNVKLKFNQMEHINTKYIKADECLQKIKEEKLITEEKFIDSQRTVASLKRQIATLQNELIEPQRRYNLLKDDLDNEKEKSTRLKRELIEERTRIKEQDNQIQIMNSQITSLNTQINDIQKSYVDDIRERDREKKQLKEIIANRERDLNDLKAEEAQRAGQLYVAFSKYLSSIGSNINS